jgi:hypothetical protein
MSAIDYENALDGALFAAGKGLRIVPCPPGKRYPVLPAWPTRATTEVKAIFDFDGAEPAADWNVAAVGGQGVFWLDIDGAEGMRWLTKMEAENGQLPATLRDRRANKEGGHWAFCHPEDVTVKCPIIAPGVEVKGAGGAVAIPPSRRPDGIAREWVNPDAEIAPAPTWLLELVRYQSPPERPFVPPREADGDSAYGLAALADEAADVRVALDGQRNSTLNRAAFAIGQLVAGGELTIETASVELENAGLANGLPPPEVRATISRALSEGMKNPRARPEPAPLSSVSSTISTAPRGLSSVSSTASTYSPPDWPAPVDPNAFYGLPGRIVRAIEPHSEADPVALLVQLLVVAGNVIGRGPHFTVEADNHYTNLNAVLVGETSKGRKGSSWGHVEQLGKSCDRTWADRIESGLSSGEGLIHAVRDPVEDAKGETTDEGVSDKRLLVLEPEFASVLRVLERQGNRLSPVVRDAWDGRTLRTLTRTTAAKATAAHISLVGHITADELRRYLDRTEVGNGFGNRFLWVCVKRSKSLPDGGQMHTVDVQPFVSELRESIRFAQTVQRVERDEEARALWHDVYEPLSAGLPGLVGALTGRAEAQVMRIADVMALLDTSSKVKLPHLQAALALWDYCRRSVEYVFGLSLGDPVADVILNALRANPDGLTRTEIRQHVGGRVSADQIERALQLLLRHHLAHVVREDTGGRPADRWIYGCGVNVGNGAKGGAV